MVAKSNIQTFRVDIYCQGKILIRTSYRVSLVSDVGTKVMTMKNNSILITYKRTKV